MKARSLKSRALLLILVGIWGQVLGQGTFYYDQQSSDESYIAGGSSIQASTPLGQSFTPTLNSVGFVSLAVYDGTENNGQGATIYLNLRTNSVTGGLLGSTEPVFVPDNFGLGTSGVTNFLFATPVALVPGSSYAFEVVLASGDPWGIAIYNSYNYSGGTAFANSVPLPNLDLWFREGIVVPEPSSTCLFVLGFVLVWFSRKMLRR